jgi:hypothetical protein
MRMIGAIAVALQTAGERMMAGQLAAVLNAEGYLTGYGTPYEGGRGTYRLLDATYWFFQRSGDDATAKAVADAFVDRRGIPAWE